MGLCPAVDANAGLCLYQILSCVVTVWRTRRGGSVPRFSTERSLEPLMTLNVCVLMRYCLGEGGVVSTRSLLDNCFCRSFASVFALFLFNANDRFLQVPFFMLPFQYCERRPLSNVFFPPCRFESFFLARTGFARHLVTDLFVRDRAFCHFSNNRFQHRSVLDYCFARIGFSPLYTLSAIFFRARVF